MSSEAPAEAGQVRLGRWSVVENQRSWMQTDLFPVQRSGHTDFPTARVDGKLLQRISANDGVTQQTVAGTVLVAGCYLEATDIKGSLMSLLFQQPDKRCNNRGDGS